ncbi:MAG: LTA synthase family protein [Burkholderiales bacterium]
MPAVLLAGFLLATSTTTRSLLALRSDVPIDTPVNLAWAIGYGLLFDAAAIGYVMAPLVFSLLLVPDFIARTRAFRMLTVVAFFAAVYGAILLGLSEWLFWDEFGSRFNFIAVDYLLYTHEVLGNIWQSYPVGSFLIAIGLAAAVLTGLVARHVWRGAGTPLRWRPAIAIALGYGLGIAGIYLYVDSDLKSLPGADAVSELAGNGVYEFFAANRRNELSYEKHYATLPPQAALATVREGFPDAEWVEPGRGGVERLVRGAGTPRRLNVVLVSIESLGAEFVGAYGDSRGLTPNLDRLATESLWFSNAYATGNRTVRGLEALSLALPPTPGQSIVRRPSNDLLFSLGSVFEDKGYGVLFAYGGYGYFDNMNAFFDANDYRVVDRREIPSSRIEFENIWGVADEHLYDQVLLEIDARKRARPERPVFVHVMTTSNHRPYTYPANRIDIPSGTGRDGAVKYTDYAIGRFIDDARRRPWFDDTVFVITADHGANARGSSRIPVEQYRIPVLIHSPRHVPPRKIERLMSQIDIPPTLLGLLRFTYYTKFFGRDVLRASPQTDRAFVANYQTLGYLRPDGLVILQPKRRIGHFTLRDGEYIPLAKPDPSLEREAIAYYQLAAHVFGSGLYRDEEQLPPERRSGAPPEARAGH